jgi:hypothetical protein
VFVYLDFANSNVTVSPDAGGGTYTPRGMGDDQLYREPTYIPVEIWWGDKNSKTSKSLMPPQLLPFGQFGEDRQLPFEAGIFQSLKWSVTFSQFGEVTSATFTSASVAAQATALFQTAASTASSIASAKHRQPLFKDSLI